MIGAGWYEFILLSPLVQVPRSLAFDLLLIAFSLRLI